MESAETGSPPGETVAISTVCVESVSSVPRLVSPVGGRMPT